MSKLLFREQKCRIVLTNITDFFYRLNECFKRLPTIVSPFVKNVICSFAGRGKRAPMKLGTLEVEITNVVTTLVRNLVD